MKEYEEHNIDGIAPTLTKVIRWALAHGFGAIVRPARLEHTATVVISTGSEQVESVMVSGLTDLGWAFTNLPIRISGDISIFRILVRLPEEQS